VAPASVIENVLSDPIDVLTMRIVGDLSTFVTSSQGFNLLSDVTDETIRHYNAGFPNNNPPQVKLMWPQAMTDSAATMLAEAYLRIATSVLRALPSRLVFVKGMEALVGQAAELNDRDVQAVRTALRIALSKRV
jgi:hypothetical protein